MTTSPKCAICTEPTTHHNSVQRHCVRQGRYYRVFVCLNCHVDAEYNTHNTGEYVNA